VQQVSHGHAALSYLVAMVAIMFTAASYGKMAGAFPSAGSTYTYAQRALNEHVGFVAGWAMMLDYFLIPLLSVIYAALTAARLLPQVPYLVWAVLFTVAITLINIRGIRVTHARQLRDDDRDERLHGAFRRTGRALGGECGGFWRVVLERRSLSAGNVRRPPADAGRSHRHALLHRL